MIDAAIKIAVAAHAGQVDKVGDPYIFHPLRVMLSLEDNASAEARSAALLHDVVEDSADPEAALKEMSEVMPPAVIAAVRLLTHVRHSPYTDYVRSIRDAGGDGGVIARQVKIADLRTNLSRLHRIEDDAMRIRLKKKYTRALADLAATDEGVL